MSAQLNMLDGILFVVFASTANITLRKTWVNATVNDAVSVAAAGGTPALISLASVANTADETDTGAVQLVPVNSVLTLSETFTTGSAANYNIRWHVRAQLVC